MKMGRESGEDGEEDRVKVGRESDENGEEDRVKMGREPRGLAPALDSVSCLQPRGAGLRV